MVIEMLETAAGPEGVLHAGKVYDLPKKRAEEYLKVGPHGRAYARHPPDGRARLTKVSRAVVKKDDDEAEDEG